MTPNSLFFNDRNRTYGLVRHNKVLCTNSTGIINKVKPRSSEQGVWSPQTPARYITLHYIKQEGHKITLHYTKADFAGIGWTGWRRTSHHVQLLPSCYINSLRQPHRPALTHITSCHVKDAFCPHSISHFLKTVHA